MTVDVLRPIAAIASPPGPALRGVIRMSGPDLLDRLGRCFEPATGKPGLTGLTGPAVLEGTMNPGPPLGPVDIDLLVWPGQRSYTRQPSAEIHTTGSPPVLDQLLALLEREGIGPAAPGEFTLRAFLAGRIDLARAEAVLGVIDSRSEAELNVALDQLAGGLSGPVESVRELLLDTLANIEAGLDFVEDDIEFVTQHEIVVAVETGRRQLQDVIDRLDRRRVTEGHVRVAICGRPNTGKSSLFNALIRMAGRTGQALVSDTAGTTRDVASCSVTIGGIPVELHDTAGNMQDWISGTAPVDHVPEIAAQADQLTGRVRQQAHMVLFCAEAGKPLDSWEQQQLADTGGVPLILVRTKCDRVALPAASDQPADVPAIGVSSRDGTGMDALCERIASLTAASDSESMVMVMGTAGRCRASLERAARELEAASQAAQTGQGDEWVASGLRLVLDELAVVTGRICTDDILDRIFSRFCIGK